MNALRMDAIAFIWKQLGASSENAPEAQLLISAWTAGMRSIWVNQVRSHDDIGWTFTDEDTGELGMESPSELLDAQNAGRSITS